MHIAIEGLDGVGKTETAKFLAKELGYEFIEKPLHYLTDTQGMDNYLRMMHTINAMIDPDFTALYYGLGNLYLRRLARGKNVVTDRDLCSTYYWNCTKGNTPLFDYLVGVCGLPDITVILVADEETRRKRLTSRDAHDSDLSKKIYPSGRHLKMVEFVERYEAKHILLDTSHMNIQQVVQEIITSIRK